MMCHEKSENNASGLNSIQVENPLEEGCGFRKIIEFRLTEHYICVDKTNYGNLFYCSGN